MSFWKEKATVVSKRMFPPDYVRLIVRCAETARAATPGQFVNILADEKYFPYLRRPIGIEDAWPERGEISLLIKIVGPGTRRMEEFAEGEKVDLIGPLGHGFALDGLAPTTILVGGGTGIAPFLHLAHEAHDKRPDARLILLYGGRSKKDIVTIDDFDGLVERAEATTEDGTFGTRGLITVLLEKEIDGKNPSDTLVLACGPIGMMRAASRLAADNGIRCLVSLETVMGCGVGSCLGCVAQVRDESADYGADNPLTGKVKYLRVCTEGPVFDASRLTWEGLG